MNTLKTLLRYLLSVKAEFLARLIFNSVGYLLSSIPFLMIRTIVQDVFNKGDFPALVLYMAGFLTLVLAAAILNYYSGYLNTRLSEKLIYRLRNDMYTALQRQSFTYFDENRTGDIISKMTSDVDQTRFFLTDTLMQTISSIVQIAISLGLLYIISSSLTWAVFPICAAIFTLIFFYQRRIHPLFRRLREEYGRINSALQENVVGVRVVRAFSTEEHEVKKFSGRNWDLLDQNMGLIKTNSSFLPFMDFIGNVSLAIVLLIGAWLAFVIGDPAVDVNSIISFFIIMQMIIGPVRFLGYFVGSYQQMIASGDRIVGILTHTSEIVDKPDAIKLPKIVGHVKFSNVSFAYPGTQRKVLKDVTIDIEPGQKVAILGPTGCGKTTFVNLIPRFYDATSGTIIIDGIDVRDCRTRSLRSQVGIVAQDTFLFSVSIKQNLTYGNVRASKDEIEEAAKIANIHDFIVTLPDGYNTVVGERGISLSGGQRQRLSIARSLLTDPRILIFDDSLSAVDVETEFLIQQALRRAMAGRTTIIITQRISSIRDADKILYMENGAVLEEGTHEELMVLGRYYARLYQTLYKQQEHHLQELVKFTQKQGHVLAGIQDETSPAQATAATDGDASSAKSARQHARELKKQEQDAFKRQQKLSEVKKKLDEARQKEETREQETTRKQTEERAEYIEKWFESRDEQTQEKLDGNEGSVKKQGYKRAKHLLGDEQPLLNGDDGTDGDRAGGHPIGEHGKGEEMEEQSHDKKQKRRGDAAP